MWQEEEEEKKEEEEEEGCQPPCCHTPRRVHVGGVTTALLARGWQEGRKERVPITLITISTALLLLLPPPPVRVAWMVST